MMPSEFRALLISVLRPARHMSRKTLDCSRIMGS